jgi:hypothetical protein
LSHGNTGVNAELTILNLLIKLLGRHGFRREVEETRGRTMGRTKWRWETGGKGRRSSNSLPSIQLMVSSKLGRVVCI